MHVGCRMGFVGFVGCLGCVGCRVCGVCGVFGLCGVYCPAKKVSESVVSNPEVGFCFVNE